MAIERKASQYVSFDNPQDLTDEQKKQALDNLGITPEMFAGNNSNNGNGCECDPPAISADIKFLNTQQLGLFTAGTTIPSGTSYFDIFFSAFSKDQTRKPDMTVNLNKTDGTTSKTYQADDSKYTTEILSKTGTLTNIAVNLTTELNMYGTEYPFTEYCYKLPTASNQTVTEYQGPYVVTSNVFNIALPDNKLEWIVSGTTNQSKNLGNVTVSAVNTNNKTVVKDVAIGSIAISKSVSYPYYYGMTTNTSLLNADYILANATKTTSLNVEKEDTVYRHDGNISSPITIVYKMGNSGKTPWICSRNKWTKCDQIESNFGVFNKFLTPVEFKLFNQTYYLYIYNTEAGGTNTFKYST